MRRYGRVIFEKGEDATGILHEALALSQTSGNNLGIYVIYAFLAEQALRNNNADLALSYLEHAKLNPSTADPWINGCYAKLYALRGDVALAEQYLENSTRPTDAAEAYLILKDNEQAKIYALAAYKWAWHDGPPFCLHYELERAKTVLKSLNIPEPQYPLKQINSHIAFEKEIRQFIEAL
ncbi:MAG: hypothetical protein ABI947_09620 [Chloroflexota bacterium]